MEKLSYSMLQAMLRTNKEFYKAGKYPFREYLLNHKAIMNKIKSSIVKIEDSEFVISITDVDDFKRRLNLLNQNYN